MKFEFCLPTLGKSVPARPEWFHEIKYDGYRLRVQRDGESVRLVTRGGHDWTKRYPWIVEAALKNRQKRRLAKSAAERLRVFTQPRPEAVIFGSPSPIAKEP